jgi:hypothetical protein
MPDGTEPIDKDEFVYRRVHEGTGYFDASRTPQLSASAFKPLNNDRDGISVTRKNYVRGPADVAATGYFGKRYFVIELRAGDLQAIGLTIRPDPQPGEMGHALIPEIRVQDVNRITVLEAMDRVRHLQFAWAGPFPGTRPIPPR